MDITKELRDISVELAEYRREIKQGNYMRALSCLNEANNIGRQAADKLRREALVMVRRGY